MALPILAVPHNFWRSHAVKEVKSLTFLLFKLGKFQRTFWLSCVWFTMICDIVTASLLMNIFRPCYMITGKQYWIFFYCFSDIFIFRYNSICLEIYICKNSSSLPLLWSIQIKMIHFHYIKNSKFFFEILWKLTKSLELRGT